MSHFSIVRDASRELRSHVFDALNTAPDVDFQFDNVGTDIVLSAPDSEIPAGAKLSIYLYSIEIDAQRRNQPPLPVGAAGLARAPLALRQHYLITPLLDSEEQNQLMIGRIMQALHDEPTIASIAGTPMDDSRGGNNPALRLAMHQLRLEDIARIWHAMGSDYRLSIAYEMRSVNIDSALDPDSADRVVDKHVMVGHKTAVPV